MVIVSGREEPYTVPETDNVPMKCPSCGKMQRGKYDWHRHLLRAHKLDFDFKVARAGPVMEDEDDMDSVQQRQPAKKKAEFVPAVSKTPQNSRKRKASVREISPAAVSVLFHSQSSHKRQISFSFLKRD